MMGYITCKPSKPFLPLVAFGPCFIAAIESRLRQTLCQTLLTKNVANIKKKKCSKEIQRPAKELLNLAQGQRDICMWSVLLSVLEYS